jgi:hypothetical protein
MAAPRTTNQRTAATAPNTATAAKIAELQIKVDNLVAQQKVLRRWLANAKGEYKPGGVVLDYYVSMEERWFRKPEARFPQFLPNSSLPWPGALKNATYGVVEDGVYYVFDGIPHVNEGWFNNTRVIYKSVIVQAIADWTTKITNAKKAVEVAKTPSGAQNSNSTGSTTDVKGATPPNDGAFVVKADLDAQPVITNVGSVREAYFSARSSAEDVVNAIKKVTTADGKAVTVYGKGANDRVGTNAPSAIRDAAELWLSAAGSKGMLQTYFPPNGYDDTNTDSSQAFDKSYDLSKYGFQFMYNPTTVSMDYFSTQNVDVAFQMSGKDKFNYVPQSGNSGAITFQILINRIFDMQYYVGGSNGRGSLISGAEKLYFPRAPYGENYKSANKNLFNEQDAIYNKGTMYDIEFLLRTILGFKMKSALRREYTADMGFFSRKMVDLHLGPRMRYRGYVNSLHIDHAMFNERMVPTLSRVSITFNRFPDYPNTGAGLTSAQKAAVAAQKAAEDTAINQKALAAGAQGRVR